MKHFLVLESEMPHSSTSSILLFKIVIDSAFLPAIPSVLIFVIVLFSIVAVDWFITTMPGNEVWSIMLSKSSTSENFSAKIQRIECQFVPEEHRVLHPLFINESRI